MIRRTKLFLFIFAAIALFSACTYNSGVSITSIPLDTPSPTAELPSPSPSEEPAPSPTAAPDPLGDYISQMSDKELIGQMIMIGFEGTKDMAAKSVNLMQEYSVGNVMLYGWNTDTFS